MKHNVFCLTITLFLLVSAQPAVALDVDQGYDPDKLPSALRSVIADEHIAIYITNGTSAWDARDDPDTRTISVVTDDNASIEVLRGNASREKTFEVLVQRDLVEAAVRESNTQDRLLDAYQAGAIKYRGVGFWNSALTTATKTTTSATTGIYSGFATVTSWVS